tara:strand:- start:918 stop:1679 length:762 start_codon:yes stop_codon:yes gene_type:complete
MPKEIQFKDVYDEIYDLMSAGDSKFPEKPMLLQGGTTAVADFNMRDPKPSAYFRPHRPPQPSVIRYNPDELQRGGGLRSEHLKNLRNVAAHELGHAKDFENMIKKLSSQDYESFREAIKYRSETMRQIETRGAQIHMPFLAKTFGRDALPLATKRSLIWKEVLGEVMKEGEDSAPNWKIVAEANKRSNWGTGAHNTRLGRGTVEALIKNMGGTVKYSSGFVYKDLAKIARKHGLLGLLMATMLTAGAGMSRDK